MKVFTVSFGGHYLGGDMVVVDETQRKAYNKAKKQIKEMGLEGKNLDFSMDDVVELDTSKKSVLVLDNGDY